MATYNPNNYLIEQVESIVSQEDVAVDLYIFDDGSSKGVDIIEGLVERYDNVFFRSDVPTGAPGKNFLRAIQLFDKKEYGYIAFSDQDDIWLDCKLIEAIEALKKHSQNGYSSNLSLYDGVGTYGTLDKYSEQVEYDHMFQGASAGCTYVVDRNLFVELQNTLKEIDILSIPKTISHDWAIYYICRAAGYVWYADNHSYIYYRQHDNNNYGASQSISDKLSMLFGYWYQSNVQFMDSLKVGDIKLDINGNFFYKLSKAFSCLKFRRNKLESIVAYFWWLIKGTNK
jgi:rhamnosyltransferase